MPRLFRRVFAALLAICGLSLGLGLSPATPAAASVPAVAFVLPTSAAASNQSASSCGGPCVVDTTTSPASGLVVVYELIGGTYGWNGHVIAVDTTPTLYGWIETWDTTTVPDGGYALVALACSNIFDKSTCGTAVKNITVTNTTVPSSVPSDCSADATTALNQYLSGLAANSTVVLSPNACFLVSSPLLLQGTSGITIQGNGAIVKEQGPIPSFSPIVNLFSDTNLSVSGLTLDGTYNGSNGGAGTEGDYGVAMESNNGVTFTNDTIENVQGDWVYMEPPYDTHGVVNTNVTFNQDTFANSGYHGFTPESVGCLTTAPCNGMTIENSTATNVGQDAFDFEVDVASSDFVNGVCVDFCEDYVTIENNTWDGWGGSDWFASIQGQAPGVQEQNLTVTNNTLNGNGPFMEVVGTEAGVTTPPYLDSNWTVSGNHYGSGFYGAPYRGGTSPFSSLEQVSNLTFTGNTVPACPGANAPACNGSPPSEYAFQAYGVSGSVENNNFTGLIGDVWPETPPTGVTATFCGNTIGPWGSTQTDATCP